jgi:hypothetical protein
MFPQSARSARAGAAPITPASVLSAASVIVVSAQVRSGLAFRGLRFMR